MEKTENLKDVKLSAIVLAGKDESNLWKANLARALAYPFTFRDYYFDKYKATLNAHPWKRTSYIPLILPGLFALNETEHVNDIVIVGRKDELEEKLENALDDFDKPIKIVQQVGRIVENGLAAAAEAEIKGHYLTIQADTPIIEANEIDRSIEQCLSKDENGYHFAHDFYQFIVSEETIKKSNIPIKKSFLKFIPEKEFAEKERDTQFRDKYGRYGFKESNYGIADGTVDLQGINDLYSIRLLFLPWIWSRAKSLVKQKGVEKEAGALVTDYLMRRATITQFQEFVCNFTGLDIDLPETEFAKFSLDIDERGDMEKLLTYNPYSSKVPLNFHDYAVPKQ